MGVSESQKKAVQKYEQRHIKKMCFKFNKKTDADVLNRFKEVGNVQGYIKALVRADIDSSDKYADTQYM